MSNFPPSPFLTSSVPSSPYLSQVSKVILLKSHKKRYLFIILSLTCICYYYYTPTTLTESINLNSAKILSKECKFLPWRKKCQPSLEPEEVFEDLVYESKGGKLFYPGRRSRMEREELILEEDIPEQAHPIHLLMNQASKNWTRKVEKQSKSLSEAVIEYERRYGMRPPRG